MEVVTPPKPKKNQDPPLVDVKVANPVTYFKKWWAKIVGNEGIEFRFRVKPLTALLIAAVVTSIAFGVGGVVISNENPTPTKTPEPDEIWKETAYTGTLQFSENNNRYYLLTTSSPEAITLEIPEIVNIELLVGKRILAIGDYNKSTKILKVSDLKDLEILSKTPIPLPTFTPNPTASSPAATIEVYPTP
ncbi:MAG: hypothetical protein ACHQUA_00870 [Microgenomates group bacterium]